MVLTFWVKPKKQIVIEALYKANIASVAQLARATDL